MNTVACQNTKCGAQTTNAWGYCDNCPSLVGAAAKVYPNKTKDQKSFVAKLVSEDVTTEKLLQWTPVNEDTWLAQELGLTKGKRQDLFDLINTWNGKGTAGGTATMNTVACKKCRTQTSNAWAYCDACPSLHGAASIVFPNKLEKQRGFVAKLDKEDIPTIEKLLSFTREDDGLLKDLGLNVGQRKNLFDWIARMNARGTAQARHVLPEVLPQLRPCDDSSTPSLSMEHVKAELRKPWRHLAQLKDIKDKVFSPSTAPFFTDTLVARAGETGLSWSKEVEISKFVCLILEDLVAALSLKFEIKQELSISLLRPDIWIVHSPVGIPAGVVEVKTPKPGVLESPWLAGQLYDYMMLLRSFYGLKSVFGIMTTYSEWRFCWLNTPDSHRLAFLDALPSQGGEKDNTTSSLKSFLEDDYIDTSEEDDSCEDQEVPDSSPSECREVYASSTYSYDDKNLLPMVASVLMKMSVVERVFPSLKDSARPFVRVLEAGWQWQRSLPFRKLKLNVFPRPTAKTFILLHDLGHGVEGRVWLAATTTGLACVIKFSLQKNQEALLRESNVWRKVWKQNTRVIELASTYALLMPFVKPLTEDEWGDTTKRNLVRAAVQELADNGFRHNDLRRRHVGLHKDSRVFIFDLSSMQNVNAADKKAKSEAVEQMLARLGLPLTDKM